ncbi:EI24 domain-containing protein [Agromyces sp. NPDC127015]|uniref:EI24 domain-containing protein n=1 Tax=Agromyces sp. NPDC127015 TaxID=3347108 RepID=UPI003652E879
MIGGFLSGVRMLARGFAFWSKRPGIMFLGLIPAAIVFVVVVAGLVGLGFGLPSITDWLTPFADDWVDPWPGIVRGVLGTVVFAAAVVLAAVTFTAVTLAVGDPFYERIWRAVETDLGGPVPEQGAGFWRAVGDSLALIGFGALIAIGVGLVGFVPLVGAVVGPVLGVVLSGRLLAAELVSRAFAARDLHGADRRRLLRGHRGAMFGFGVATQLCFMVPLGAVFTMPAAVAGSTMLARAALDGVTSSFDPAHAPRT